MQCKKCGEELVGNKSICNMCGTYNVLGRAKEKKLREMIAALKIGDEVASVDGMRGKVVTIKDDVIVLETGIGTTKSFIAIESNAIARLIKEGTTKAADVAPISDYINNEILNETIGNNVAEDSEHSEQERKKRWRNSFLVASILIVVITSWFLNNENLHTDKKSYSNSENSSSVYKSSTSSSTTSSANSNSSTSATEPSTPPTPNPTTPSTPNTNTETKKAISMYPNYPTVPDFGAMFDVEPANISHEDGFSMYGYSNISLNNTEKYRNNYIDYLEDNNFIYMGEGDSILGISGPLSFAYSNDKATIIITTYPSGGTMLTMYNLPETPINIPTYTLHPTVPDFAKLYKAPIISQGNKRNYTIYQYPISYINHIDDYIQKLTQSGFYLSDADTSDTSGAMIVYRKGTRTIGITASNYSEYLGIMVVKGSVETALSQ